jgi:hypothetical protein
VDVWYKWGRYVQLLYISLPHCCEQRNESDVKEGKPGMLVGKEMGKERC